MQLGKIITDYDLYIGLILQMFPKTFTDQNIFLFIMSSSLYLLISTFRYNICLTCGPLTSKHAPSLALFCEARSHKRHPQITVMNRSIPLSSRVYKTSFGLPLWYMLRARSHLAFQFISMVIYAHLLHLLLLLLLLLLSPSTFKLDSNNLVTDDVKEEKV